MTVEAEPEFATGDEPVCGAHHPDAQHRTLRCERRLGHKLREGELSEHKARLGFREIPTLAWTRSPDDEAAR